MKIFLVWSFVTCLLCLSSLALAQGPVDWKSAEIFNGTAAKLYWTENATDWQGGIEQLLESHEIGIADGEMPELDWITKIPAGSIVGRGLYSDQSVFFSFCPAELGQMLICNPDPVPIVVICPDGNSPPCSWGGNKASAGTSDECEYKVTELEKVLCRYEKIRNSIAPKQYVSVAWDGVSSFAVSPIKSEVQTVEVRSGLPSVVALLDETDKVRCSGTIVSNSYILTAAHCVCDRGAQLTRAWIGSPVGEPRNDQNGGFSQGFDLIASGDNGIHIYPSADGTADFCALTDDARRNLPDLALIPYELPTGITSFTDNYVSAPSFGSLPESTSEYWYVGYGTGSPEKGIGRGLGGPCGSQSGSSTCSEGIDATLDRIDDRKQNLCGGDSGGPLFLEDDFVGVSRRLADSSDSICDDGSIFSIFAGSKKDKIREWFAKAGVVIREGR
jgi:Trypsin